MYANYTTMVPDMSSVDTSPQTVLFTPSMYLSLYKVATSCYIGDVYKPEITKVEIIQFPI